MLTIQIIRGKFNGVDILILCNNKRFYTTLLFLYAIVFYSFCEVSV